MPLTDPKSRSAEWFKDVLKRVNRNAKKTVDEYGKKRKRRRIAPGEMIAFMYLNPKTPLPQLKWFDAHPLDIILAVDGRYMLCINLHYVPVPMRELIMKQVIKINKVNIRNSRRFELSYSMMKEFLHKHGLAEFVIKLYIIGRMKGVTHIPYLEWEYAAKLPSERFVFDGAYSIADIHALIRRGARKTKSNKGKRKNQIK